MKAQSQQLLEPVFPKQQQLLLSVVRIQSQVLVEECGVAYYILPKLFASEHQDLMNVDHLP
jgi:hypothetical protein